MKEIWLIRGIPGSGKSEFAETVKSVSKGGSVKMVAADDFRMVDGEYVFNSIPSKEAHQKCRSRVGEWLRGGTSIIIVHNTFTEDWEMQEYFNLAEEHGYKIRTVIVENRHGGVNTHGVPVEHLKRMEDRFSVHLSPNLGIHTTLQDSIQECLTKLKNVPQRPDYHPEIWVYDHIAIVTGGMIVNGNSPELIWAGLFHDLGKLETSKVNIKTGHIISYGHEDVSAKYVEKFASVMPDTVDYDTVLWLVKNHMRAKQVDRMGSSKAEVLTSNPNWGLMWSFGKYDNMVSFYNQDGVAKKVAIRKYAFESWLESNGLV